MWSQGMRSFEMRSFRSRITLCVWSCCIIRSLRTMSTSSKTFMESRLLRWWITQDRICQEMIRTEREFLMERNIYWRVTQKRFQRLWENAVLTLLFHSELNKHQTQRIKESTETLLMLILKSSQEQVMLKQVRTSPTILDFQMSQEDRASLSILKQWRSKAPRRTLSLTPKNI